MGSAMARRPFQSTPHARLLRHFYDGVASIDGWLSSRCRVFRAQERSAGSWRREGSAASGELCNPGELRLWFLCLSLRPASRVHFGPIYSAWRSPAFCVARVAGIYGRGALCAAKLAEADGFLAASSKRTSSRSTGWTRCVVRHRGWFSNGRDLLGCRGAFAQLGSVPSGRLFRSRDPAVDRPLLPIAICRILLRSFLLWHFVRRDWPVAAAKVRTGRPCTHHASAKCANHCNRFHFDRPVRACIPGSAAENWPRCRGGLLLRPINSRHVTTTDSRSVVRRTRHGRATSPSCAAFLELLRLARKPAGLRQCSESGMMGQSKNVANATNRCAEGSCFFDWSRVTG